MTTPTVTHIYFLLDRSGSMASIADDVIGGFNTFLADQQADGDDAVMTLVQFDTHDPYELVADACPIREVIALTDETFLPRAGTPLYDSLGRLLGRAVNRANTLDKNGEPPEDVVVAVFTDGAENSSGEFTRTQVFDLVTAQETERDWTFAYLGANQDAFTEARAVGISAGSSRDFAATSAGTHGAMNRASAAMLRHRSRSRTGTEHSGEFFDDEE
jgi:hypothetical protein